MNNNFNNLLFKANSLFKKGKYQSAIDVYLMLLTFNNNYFELHFNLSLSYFYLNDIENSIKYATSAINIKKNDIFLARHMFNLCTLKPDNLDFLTKFQEIVDVLGDVDLCFKCSSLLKQINQTNNALYFLQKILEVDNNNVKALKEVASIYLSIDKEVAIEMCDELYKNFPDNREVLDFTLSVYNDIQNFEKCIEILKRLLKFEKKVFYYVLLATSLISTYKYIECEDVLDEAIKFFPDDTTIKNLLIQVCHTNKNIEKAYALVGEHKYDINFIESYAKLRLSDREISDVRSQLYKKSTEFVSDEKILEKAKKMYYALNVKERFNLSEKDFIAFRTKSSKFGHELENKVADKLILDKEFNDEKLLVLAMNGVGDLLMSARYFPILKERNIQTSLLIVKSLYTLIKNNFPYLNIITSVESIDNIEFDCASSDLNLINVLKMDLKNIPFSSGYLKVSDELVNEKSKLVNFDAGKLKVGLFWQGNPTLLRNRSIKLSELIPLFENTNRQLYSFQISKDDFESDKLKSELNLIDLAPHITNYEDTAAFLKNIDVLVTIDTSIAHLAGALGVKTFLLLPYETEWRWFNDTQTTPWYDSVRIFKQGPDAKWDDVVNRVNIELENAKL